MAGKRITLMLTDSNEDTVQNVASVLNKPVQEVISFCLEGSTNLRPWLDQDIKNFCRAVQPTHGKKTHQQEKQK